MSFIALPSVSIEIAYGVQRGDGSWIRLDRTGNTGFTKSGSSYISNTGSCIFIPVDPITAIRSGAVTVSELGLPPGIEAMYNMLK